MHAAHNCLLLTRCFAGPPRCSRGTRVHESHASKAKAAVPSCGSTAPAHHLALCVLERIPTWSLARRLTHCLMHLTPCNNDATVTGFSGKAAWLQSGEPVKRVSIRLSKFKRRLCITAAVCAQITDLRACSPLSTARTCEAASLSPVGREPCCLPPPLGNQLTIATHAA